MALPIKAITSIGNIKIPTVSENPWVDLGVKVRIVGGVAYGGFLLLREAGIIADKRGEKEQKKTEKSDLEKLKVQGIVPTMTDSSYLHLADMVYEGLRYSALADSPALVRKALKQMKNDADVLKLSQAYGQRQRYGFGVPVGERMGLIASVSADSFALTKNLINKDWEPKGITYRV